MTQGQATNVAKALVEAFGSTAEAHRGYQRAMQNNCTFHQFKLLLPAELQNVEPK